MLSKNTDYYMMYFLESYKARILSNVITYVEATFRFYIASVLLFKYTCFCKQWHMAFLSYRRQSDRRFDKWYYNDICDVNHIYIAVMHCNHST